MIALRKYCFNARETFRQRRVATQNRVAQHGSYFGGGYVVCGGGAQCCRGGTVEENSILTGAAAFPLFYCTARKKK